MELLPRSLRVSTASWFIAVFLSVAGAVAGIVATFLPMKAILILSAGSVPTFFPQFLVSGAVGTTAVLMLIVAALFGAISWLAPKVREKLDQAGTPSAVSGVASDWISQDYSLAMSRRETASGLTLLVALALVVGLVSLTFLLLSMVWTLVIFWLALVRASRVSGVARRPFQEAGDLFVRWAKESSIWASVGIALLTLLIVPPSLGTTGILIAAIFGRRSLTAVSEVVTLYLSRLVITPEKPRLRQTGRATLAPRPGQTRAIDHFSTVAGHIQLRTLAVSMGFAAEDWRLIGDPGSAAMSIAIGSGDSQHLVRIFPPRLRSGRDMELRRRLRRELHGPFEGGDSSELMVNGFPALMVNLSGRDCVHSAKTVSRAEATKFQIKLELTLADMRPADGGSLLFAESVEGEIREGLEKFLRLPGSHRGVTASLLDILPVAIRLAGEAPLTLVPDGRLREKDFYKTKSGEIRYLGGHLWTLGKLGYNWARSQHYESLLREEILDSSSYSNRLIPLARLNAAVGALGVGLKAFDFSSLCGLESQLYRTVQELQVLDGSSD